MHLETGLSRNSTLRTHLKKLRFLDERGHDGVDDKSRDDDDDDDYYYYYLLFHTAYICWVGPISKLLPET